MDGDSPAAEAELSTASPGTLLKGTQSQAETAMIITRNDVNESNNVPTNV
jgi:hypothetical protein